MNREMGFPTSALAKRESQRERVLSFKSDCLLTEGKREGKKGEGRVTLPFVSCV